MPAKKKNTKKTSAKKVSDTDKIINELKKMSADNTKLMQKYNSKEAVLAREFNADEAATAREFNSIEAEKARDWQQLMSNTSHQREVADLKAAGLNPVLSANGGAQSYTSASASAQNASAQNANSGIDSALGSISGIVSSLFGAEATKAASANSAAATKYAADQNLKAAQEAASAARYSADVHYLTEMDKPQSSWAALADKYFNKVFPNAFDKGVVDEVKFSIKKKVSSAIIKSKSSLDSFLDIEGQSLVGAWLLKNGYADTWKNKGLWILSLNSINGDYYKSLMEKKVTGKKPANGYSN